MSLKSKLGTRILATSLGLAGLTGCAGMTEDTKNALLQQMVVSSAAVELRKKGEYDRAQAVENLGNVIGAMEVAKAGRSEVNVNVNTNESGRNSQTQKNYSNRRVPNFFMANYWKDLNENESPETNEIVGYMNGNKRDFNQEENVSFWVQNYVRDAGLPIEFKIYNPKGEEIYFNTFRGIEIGFSQVIPDFEGFSPDYFEDKGTYIALYSIDGKFKESIQFNIH